MSVPTAGRDGPARVRAAVAEFFALDDDWQREPRLDRWDLLVGALMLYLSLITLELVRSGGGLEDVRGPGWAPWLAVLTGSLLLVGRRRWPLTVLLLAAVHMFVVGTTMPIVMSQLSLQIVYFCAIFSGVAWARGRREMLVVVSGVLTFMFAWVAWNFAVGSGIDDIRESLEDDATKDFGLVSPITAWVLLSAVVNLLYFVGAVIAGQVAWRGARQRARLAEQAAQLTEQAQTLHRQAVVEERLRIARELHDVVAHHVSVIGISAGAARRVLPRDVEAAGRALGQIEESSREAVGQMRGLLGALRAHDGTPTPDAGQRTPEPGVCDLPALVETLADSGFSVTFQRVEEPTDAAGRLPGPVSLALYRTAQEALANVRRHSTARSATVVLRVVRRPDGGHAEIEVTDDGRPVPGTSGSGLGQLGIRERVAALRGLVDIGPRVTGGYRVRVRLPLTPFRTATPVSGHDVPPRTGSRVEQAG